MQFTQHVVFYTQDEDALMALVADWTAGGAGTPGFNGGRIHKFRDKPGRYVLQADFDSWEAAEANNDRPETQANAERLMGLVDGEVKYENLDVLGEF
jgi:quinol monooxygenase YgiN